MKKRDPLNDSNVLKPCTVQSSGFLDGIGVNGSKPINTTLFHHLLDLYALMVRQIRPNVLRLRL